MEAGLPVITVKADWVIHIIGNNYPGAADNNPESIARMVDKIIEDREFREELLKWSKKVSNRYSFQSMIDEYTRELLKLCG